MAGLLHHLALVVDLHPRPIQTFPSYVYDLSRCSKAHRDHNPGKKQTNQQNHLRHSQYLAVERIRRNDRWQILKRLDVQTGFKMSLSTKLLEPEHLFQRFSVYTMFTQQMQLGHTNKYRKCFLQLACQFMCTKYYHSTFSFYSKSTSITNP